MQCTISRVVYTKDAWKPSLHILHLQVDQGDTVLVIQVVSLNSCYLFLLIFVTDMK